MAAGVGKPTKHSKKMNYYKVRKEDDQRGRYRRRGRALVEKIGIYVANELLTAKEAKRGNYDPNRLQLIETSKRNTYFCFGVRFADNENAVALVHYRVKVYAVDGEKAPLCHVVDQLNGDKVIRQYRSAYWAQRYADKMNKSKSK